MSYIEELYGQVDEVFGQAPDKDALRQMVLDLVIAKSKESFKNGLEAARNRQFTAKGRKVKKA